MSHYWARFIEQDGEILRFDTRVYLNACAAPQARDPALGAIIGKNPGSALPLVVSGRLQALTLQGDHFLPSVLSVVRKAYLAADTEPQARGYIRVLNLFYLCNRDLRQAKSSLRRGVSPKTCATEAKATPWTWFAWGGDDPSLNPLKTRFLRRSRKNSFYYCNTTKSVKTGPPARAEKARHTQGMPHEAVVSHLATCVRRCE